MTFQYFQWIYLAVRLLLIAGSGRFWRGTTYSSAMSGGMAGYASPPTIEQSTEPWKAN